MNGNTIRLTYIFICRKERDDLTSFSLKKISLPPSVLQDSGAYLNCEITPFLSQTSSSAKTPV